MHEDDIKEFCLRYEIDEQKLHDPVRVRTNLELMSPDQRRELIRQLTKELYGV